MTDGEREVLWQAFLRGIPLRIEGGAVVMRIRELRVESPNGTAYGTRVTLDGVEIKSMTAVRLSCAVGGVWLFEPTLLVTSPLAWPVQEEESSCECPSDPPIKCGTTPDYMAVFKDVPLKDVPHNSS